MFWKNKLKTISPIRDITDLPNYGFMFFLRNMGVFKVSFFILTAVSIASATIGFLATYLISDILTNISSLSIQKVLFFYFPIFLGLKIIIETLDFFTRKYAESFPKIYTDLLKLRFYKTLLTFNFLKVFNYSKERLIMLIDRYVGGVASFLGEWVWSTPESLTKLVIITIILFIQNPFILLANILFLTLYMLFAFKLSKKYAVVEREYTNRIIENEPITQSFLLNLNTVKRLGITDFFELIYKRNTNKVWERFKDVRDEHSIRWFIQLNIYNIIYAGTFFYGVYQVVTGILPLGFLILIKWSYDNLWQITVHFIGVFVGLIQQREGAKIVRQEFSKILIKEDVASKDLSRNWNKIELKDVNINFLNPKGDKIEISVPKLTINRGEKVGIIGESGSGKTTLLYTLLNLYNYSGTYKIDGVDAKNIRFKARDITIINSSDPLFNISILDNILLGRKANNNKLSILLNNLQVSKSFENLNVIIGDKDVHYSSGQLQRIRLLRGLLTNSKIYLLDEPFNGIDKKNKDLIMDFVKKYLKNNTVLLVTHIEDELSIVDKKYKFEGSTLKEVE